MFVDGSDLRECEMGHEHGRSACFRWRFPGRSGRRFLWLFDGCFRHFRGGCSDLGLTDLDGQLSFAGVDRSSSFCKDDEDDEGDEGEDDDDEDDDEDEDDDDNEIRI